ncbi:dTDP-4-dehydrorhamnose 3,5-epimerase family protein [Rhodobacteraceae bacterium nBUS_24]
MIDDIETETILEMPEIKLIKHTSFSDSRGKIFSLYNRKTEKLIFPPGFVHDKFTLNKKNVLRGIHGDHVSTKLVTCIVGEVFQVIVDCRKNSKNFGNWVSFNLNSESNNAILIPPGFGNAFLSLNDNTVYHYKLSYPKNYVDADEQFTFRWDDDRFAIDWPTNNPILSSRDACH